MFSPSTLKNVSRVVQFGACMGFIPYKVMVPKPIDSVDVADRRRHQCGVRLEPRRDRAWTLWKIFVLLGIAFCLLKAVIVLYFIQTGIASNMKKALELFAVVAMTYGMVFHLNTVLYRDEVSALFNYMMDVNRRFTTVLTSPRTKDGLELYVKFYTGVTVLFLVSFYPFMYNRKSEVQNLYTYLGGTQEFYRLSYQLLEFLIASSYFTLATFYNFLIVGTANSMLFWIGFLNRSTEPSGDIPAAGNEMIKNLRRVTQFRQIGFIDLLYQKSLAKFLIVIGFGYCSAIFILSSYVVMKYYNSLGVQGAGSVMIVAVMAQIMIVVCFRFSNETTLNSRKFITILRQNLNGSTREESKVLRRTVNCLRPIVIRIGNFLTVERSTLLSSIDFNLSSLINLLLTFELSKL